MKPLLQVFRIYKRTLLCYNEEYFVHSPALAAGRQVTLMAADQPQDARRKDHHFYDI